MPVDRFGRMSDAKTRDTGVSLTYINNNYIRSDGGTPVSGSIDMRGNTLYNVSDPVNPQDVATKEYADQVGGGVAVTIETQYGTCTARGDIDMQFFTLTNVMNPEGAQDVATKQYVDDTADKAFIYSDGGTYLAVGDLSMGDRRLSNFELEDAAKKLKIPSFRGVFLLDTLPKKPNKKECGIVNFDKSGGPGTHWVAWY